MGSSLEITQCEVGVGEWPAYSKPRCVFLKDAGRMLHVEPSGGDERALDRHGALDPD